MRVRWTGYGEIRYFPKKLHTHFDSETTDERHNVSVNVVWLKIAGDCRNILACSCVIFFFFFTLYYNVWINFEIICEPDGLYPLIRFTVVGFGTTSIIVLKG